MSIEGFAYPRTPEEAVAALAVDDRKAVVVAGGTTVSKQRFREPTILVDISRCGLDRIEVEPDRIRVGAMVRCADLAVADLPGATGAILCEAAAGVASRPLRNAITIGGNVVQMASWSDLPVALLAVDATVQLLEPGGTAREVPMATLAEQHPHKALPKGSLVTGFSVPLRQAAQGGVYRRFRTSATDYSLVALAVYLELQGGRCQAPAVALGAVGPRPARATAAEQMLQGKPVSPGALAEAARAAAEAAQVVSSPRMEPEYRRRILQVEIRRALDDAAKSARIIS